MVVFVILVGLLSVSSGEVNIRELYQQNHDRAYVHLDPGVGHFENCGIAKNFSMEWKPKVLLPRGKVTATVNLNTPYDWANGKVTLAIFLKDLPDTPIIQVSQEVTCEALKMLLPLIKCPYKAHDLISIVYTEQKLPALPTGEYIMKVQLNNSKGQEVICGKGDVNIID